MTEPNLRRLVTLVARDDTGAGSETSDELLGYLTEIIAASRRSYDPSGGLDISDFEIAVQSLDSFRSALASDRADRILSGNPVGYLIRIARNRLIDAVRRNSANSREILVGSDDPVLDGAVDFDEEILTRLNALSTRDSLVDALRTARSYGDHRAVEVVEIWLRLAVRTGSAPSHAAVGRESGLTGPGVRHVLDRFAGYFR